MMGRHGVLQSVIISAAILLAVPAGALNRTPTRAQTLALDRFRATEGSSWRASWDDNTGTIRSLFAGDGRQLALWQTDHPAAARSFVESYADLIGLRTGLDNLEVYYERGTSRGYQVRLRQLYQGLPVIGGEYALSVGSGGTLRMFTGQFFPDIALSPTPAIRPSAAERVALHELPRFTLDGSVPSRLVVYTEREPYRLAYEIHLRRGDLPYVAYVDAQAAMVIDFYCAAPRYSGSGNVVLGCNTRPVVTRTLERLDGPVGGVWHLTGQSSPATPSFMMITSPR